MPRGVRPARYNQFVPYFAYRVVRNQSPGVTAFASHAEMGDTPPLGISPSALNDWDGVSVFETHDQAARHARKYTHLGRFIAELLIPDEAPISRDVADRRGHFNLRGSGAAIFSCLVGVSPIA